MPYSSGEANMSLATRSREVFRFGTFEVDTRAGELRKQGVRIKLQEQRFRVLTILLQQPGGLVTRDELRSQIWPADTFVDFDNSLNTAINKLREALGILQIVHVSLRHFHAVGIGLSPLSPVSMEQREGPPRE